MGPLASLPLWASLALFPACERGVQGGPNYPEAETFERDPQFRGEWVGAVASVPGILTLGELEPGKLLGSFKADERDLEYVLLLEQNYQEAPLGGMAPTNLVTFTWQDGRGGRGIGWLLINRENSALTGSFGYDTAAAGLGEWSLVRAG